MLKSVRMLIIVAVFIAGLIAGAISFLYYFQIVVLDDFTFGVQLPSFSEEQRKILAKTSCVINSNLEEPEKYYVYDVLVKDSFFIVNVSTLSSLQNGSNSKGTFIKTSFGSAPSFYFNKNFELIKIDKNIE